MKPFFTQMGFSLSVFLLAQKMRLSIKLNYQSFIKATEISDILVNGYLSSKLESVKSSVA